ncbi:MAG: hypothetical protein Q3962_01390 [Corynebacterium sp.]|nr:hypothetical protein [Corynebacterium sp.]
MAKSKRKVLLPVRSASIALSITLSAATLSAAVSVPSYAEDNASSASNSNTEAAQKTAKEQAQAILETVKQSVSTEESKKLNQAFNEASDDTDYLGVARSAVTALGNSLSISTADKATVASAASSADFDVLNSYLNYLVTYQNLSNDVNSAPGVKTSPAYKFATTVERTNYNTAISRASDALDFKLNDTNSLTALKEASSSISTNYNALSGQTALTKLVGSLRGLTYITEEQGNAMYDYGAQADNLASFASTVRDFASAQFEVFKHVNGREQMHKAAYYLNATDAARKTYDDAVNAGEAAMKSTDVTDVTGMTAAMNAINNAFDGLEPQKEGPTNWRTVALAALGAAAGGGVLAAGAASLLNNQQNTPAPAAEPSTEAPAPAPASAPAPAPAPAAPVERPKLANTGSTPWMLLIATMFLGMGIIMVGASRRKVQEI